VANKADSVGLFIPTTNIWDVQQIQEVDVNSEQFKELLVRLYQNVNNIALAVNLKDSGYYNTLEFVNSQLFFPNPALSSKTAQTAVFRQVYRKVINFGALPNTGAKSVNHYIDVNPAFSFTRIYATATNPDVEFIPIPYASASGADNIELSVSDTQVTITTASDRTAFTITYVILEFLKF